MIPSTPKRILAVGDIHGCLTKLRYLLERVSPTSDDLLVFLGDYIDRGLEIPETIEHLIQFSHRNSVVFLRGNHEDMLIKYIEQRDGYFLLNGGAETLYQYQKSIWGEIPSHHLDFFKSTRRYYQTDEFIFVHAGLKPGISLEDQRDEDLLWIREEFLNSEYEWGKTVVFGHSPFKEPVFNDNRIGLDTGAALSPEKGFGNLTCCEVQSRNYWQVA